MSSRLGAGKGTGAFLQKLQYTARTRLSKKTFTFFRRLNQFPLPPGSANAAQMAIFLLSAVKKDLPYISYIKGRAIFNDTKKVLDSLIIWFHDIELYVIMSTVVRLDGVECNLHEIIAEYELTKPAS